MADRKRVWLYIYEEKNREMSDAGPAFLVFAKKDEALKQAADVVKDLAAAEKSNFGWEADDPQPELLDEIVAMVGRKDLENAIDAWEEYRSEYDADGSVTVLEVDFFE